MNARRCMKWTAEMFIYNNDSISLHPYRSTPWCGQCHLTWHKGKTWPITSSRGSRRPESGLRVDTSCPATVPPLISWSLSKKTTSGETHLLPLHTSESMSLSQSRAGGVRRQPWPPLRTRTVREERPRSVNAVCLHALIWPRTHHSGWFHTWPSSPPVKSAAAVSERNRTHRRSVQSLLHVYRSVKWLPRLSRT